MGVAKEMAARLMMAGAEREIPKLVKFLVEYEDDLREHKARAMMAGIEKKLPDPDDLIDALTSWPKAMTMVESIFGFIGQLTGKNYVPSRDEVRLFRDKYGARALYLEEERTRDDGSR